MSEEPSLIVCARADTALICRGTKFDHFCAKCGQRVAVAPTGQVMLKQHPHLRVICLPCAPAELESKENVQIELAAEPNKIAYEARDVIANPFRRRN